jgi:cation diffusion facilitator family transporter
MSQTLKTQQHNTSRYIRFVTVVGLIVNILLTTVKFWAGIVGHSQALVADAIHSLSDTISDLAIIIGSYFWSKPADADHPYGHRRIETIITLFVGLMLVLAAVGIIRQAFLTMHGSHHVRPALITAAVAALSVVVKESLYRWTRQAGEKCRSGAVIANAWHHRSDAMSSIPALLSIVGSIMLPGMAFLDRLGAVVVALFILQAAHKIMLPGLKELIDTSADDEICRQIREIAMQMPEVRDIHRLRARLSGARLYVDLHMVVDGDITVRHGHEIGKAVKNRIINSNLQVVDVIIHLEAQ